MIRKLLSVAAGLLVAFASISFTLNSAQAQGDVIVQGDITQSTTWTPDKTYVLSGAVFVKGPAVLTILPGTTIKGLDRSFLVIDQGAKINAEGTPTAPIVFTSAQNPGSRTPKDWGGLWVNGNAPINTPGGTELGETGITGMYGGGMNPNPHDSSGIIRYVRIEFGGFPLAPDREINNFTLAGVGDGTAVDHIHCNRGGDDAIEFFGGTANVKYILCTGPGDDGFDWQTGYVGKAQFVVVQEDNSVDPASDRGIEADNNENNNEFTPFSNPTLYNFTLVGDKSPGGGGAGVVLRRGTAGTHKNFIVMNYKGAGIDIQGDVSQRRLGNGELVVSNSIVFGNNPNFATGATATALGAVPTIQQTDPKLRDPFVQGNPDFRPADGSLAKDSRMVATTPSDGFFTPVNFVGGVDPENDWTKGSWIKINLN